MNRVVSQADPAVTGYAQQSDYERSRVAGFDRHFVEALDIDVIDRVLRELSEATGAGDPAQL